MTEDKNLQYTDRDCESALALDDMAQFTAIIPEPEWYNTKEAAELLGVTQHAILNRISRGTLKSEYVTGGRFKRYIHRDELLTTRAPARIGQVLVARTVKISAVLDAILRVEDVNASAILEAGAWVVLGAKGLGNKTQLKEALANVLVSKANISV